MPRFDAGQRDGKISYAYYIASVIPGGMYAGNPDDVATFGTQAVLVTSSNQPDALAYGVVKTVEIEALEEIAGAQRQYDVCIDMADPGIAGEVLQFLADRRALVEGRFVAMERVGDDALDVMVLAEIRGAPVAGRGDDHEPVELPERVGERPREKIRVIDTGRDGCDLPVPAFQWNYE